jgi:hypothetical protein
VRTHTHFPPFRVCFVCFFGVVVVVPSLFSLLQTKADITTLELIVNTAKRLLSSNTQYVASPQHTPTPTHTRARTPLRTHHTRTLHCTLTHSHRPTDRYTRIFVEAGLLDQLVACFHKLDSYPVSSLVQLLALMRILLSPSFPNNFHLFRQACVSSLASSPPHSRCVCVVCVCVCVVW